MYEGRGGLVALTHCMDLTTPDIWKQRWKGSKDRDELMSPSSTCTSQVWSLGTGE
jgi:hypothetical protein